MDFVTDTLIGLFIQKKLFEHFLKFYEDIIKDCKYSPKLAELPIRVSIFYITFYN